MSSLYFFSICLIAFSSNRGFALNLAAGSPLSETAVKMRKLVASSTGML